MAWNTTRTRNGEMYRIVFSRQAEKDRARLKQAGLEKKARELLGVIMRDPYAAPPRYEKLTGDMQGLYSRRINIRHRLVYEVDEANGAVHVLRMWTHYGEN